jgi:hypothetical protein
VDYDPIVLAHAKVLPAGAAEGVTAYLDTDLRDPEAIRRLNERVRAGNQATFRDGASDAPVLRRAGGS